MRKCGMATLPACFLLLLPMFAHAAARNSMMRIKVLASETSAVESAANVPKNCDTSNYDAYCHSGKTTEMMNTLVVQEGDGPPFHIACTVESRWSRCVPLPKDQTYDAKREKRGLVVFYVDDAGKTRSQLYTLFPGEVIEDAGLPAAKPEQAPEPKPEQAPAPAAAEDPGVVGEVTLGPKRETVKCNFTSTPPGAEVTVDGRYMGSTPSVLGLATGMHVVMVSKTGFAEWRRNLAVSAGSDPTINAVLEKAK